MGGWERTSGRLECAREERVPEVNGGGHAGGREQSANQSPSAALRDECHAMSCFAMPPRNSVSEWPYVQYEVVVRAASLTSRPSKAGVYYM